MSGLHRGIRCLTRMVMKYSREVGRILESVARDKARRDSWEAFLNRLVNLFAKSVLTIHAKLVAASCWQMWHAPIFLLPRKREFRAMPSRAQKSIKLPDALLVRRSIVFLALSVFAATGAVARAADDVNNYQLVCEWIEPKNKAGGGFNIDNPSKKLVPSVRKWIKDGWKPIGGVDITALPEKYSADLLACQALVYSS